VTIGYFSFTLPGVLIDFKGVTKGLVMEAEKTKKKTRRNSIKNRKGNPKKGIRKIKRNTIYNL
jgi:hypothetical protein